MADDKKKDDIQVLVPYSVLLGLLEAPKQMEEMKAMLKHHNRLIGSIRGQLIEVIDKLREMQQ